MTGATTVDAGCRGDGCKVTGANTVLTTIKDGGLVS
jgi:hypothetical protein